ncbi:MAG: flagellar biosynthetic protein FliO [Thermodesulfobacteriota bacterium]|nr:flagellar biosynthetic protein FliO [Thermodesulfobacteriota bacterium]
MMRASTFANVAFIVCTVALPTMVIAVESAETDLLPMGIKVTGALVVVLGLVMLLYALLKKSGRWIPSAQNREIRLIEVRYLSPKKALYLVEVKGSTLLISGSGDRLETLAKWSGEPSTPTSFDRALQEQLLPDLNDDNPREEQ